LVKSNKFGAGGVSIRPRTAPISTAASHKDVPPRTKRQPLRA
jgi:hypothetical protein